MDEVQVGDHIIHYSGIYGAGNKTGKVQGNYVGESFPRVFIKVVCGVVYAHCAQLYNNKCSDILLVVQP